MKHATLSLVLPVRNAATHLATVVQDCLNTVPRFFADYEIIIVDDGSQDDTLAIAYDLAYVHDPIMVIHHPRKRGYGQALGSGLNSARGDHVLGLDVHGAVHIRELERMMPYIEHYQVIVGYRLQQRATWQQFWSGLLRRFINKALAIDVRDIDSRVILLQAHMLEQMTFNMSSALIHTEIYARANRLGMTCLQVGVQEDQTPPRSRLDRWPGLGAFWETLQLWRNLHGSSASAGGTGQHQHSFWQPRLVWAVGLVAVVRGAWLLLRRRG